MLENRIANVRANTLSSMLMPIIELTSAMSIVAVVAYGGSLKETGHTEWVDFKVHETGFTAAFPPNTRVAYSSGGADYDVDFVSAGETSLAADTYAAVTSRSYHPGVVNALLMDGSVRFYGNGVSRDVWRALGTRAGGEAVAAD